MSAAGIDARRARAQRLRGLYAVTPHDEDTARLVARVQAALRGGARAVQYRNKAASRSRKREQAAALAPLCRASGALFIVNDDAQLAREVGADGVHLGADDGSVAAARAVVGDAALVGVSCYDEIARAQRAVAEGGDYVAFGSFFPSRVKPGAVRADPALIAAARRLGVPVVAIGGITAANARGLVDAGIDAVAVISDVFERDTRDDIERAAGALAACFAKTVTEEK